MTFSPIAADHLQRPRHRGPLENVAYGVSGVPGDGAYVEIWTRVEGDRIAEAAFRTPGCPSSIAAASLLCELATGREVQRVKSLTDADLLSVLGGLPEGKEQYAALAIEAMKASLEEES